MKKFALLTVGAAALLATGVVIGRSTGDRMSIEQPAAAAAPSGRAQLAARIGDDAAAPAISPKGATITISFFSDYQCPYCRKAHPIIEQLVREDGKVRLVFRDWPIFGGASTEAARAAIAAQYQGKHEAFDTALMTAPGQLSSASIKATAVKAGVNWQRLQADLAAHGKDIDGVMARSNDYAKALGLDGTPGILVGPYLIPGAVDLATLRKAVAYARAHPQGDPQY